MKKGSASRVARAADKKTGESAAADSPG